jgi:SAM-dependent methyltransferase
VQLPFPEASFDVIALLATIEHMQEKDALAEESRRLLVPLGRIVITVPQPAVERLLQLLVATRLADGMSLEDHHGFDPADTERLFCSRGFTLEHHSRFQWGMNNLFVFRSPG